MDDAKKLKILIADDEEGLRMSMAGILELEGHDVSTAESGYEAIEIAKKQSFDIAFLDIRMPGLNGVETFKEIKKHSPETIVIMMTAFAVNELIKEAIAEGAYACVNKPLDMDKLAETVKALSKKPFAIVIDDDPQLCSMIDSKFKENGFNVVTKISGLDGIEIVKRKIPDIIVLDVSNPEMSNLATYEKIKKLLGPNCPKIIILNSKEAVEHIKSSDKSVVVEYIPKPLDLTKLENVICGTPGQNRKLKVCVVDDDKVLCDSIKLALNSIGYEVDTAYSGQEVIERLEKEIYKVIVLDVRLPDINGIDVYEKIKKLNSDIGVIFISGFFSEEDLGFVINKNNYIYLHKPFEPENLIKLIDQIKEKNKQKELNKNSDKEYKGLEKGLDK